MSQYEDHIIPVLISFIGILISSILNLIQMCLHHDRPFQLMSSINLRLNIVIGIAAPFIFISEFVVYLFISHFDFFSMNLTLSNFFFLIIPIIPLIFGCLASFQNIKLTSQQSRTSLVNDFVHEANEDEQMLLASQMEGIPRTSGSILENEQALNLINKHYKPIYYTSVSSIIFDILFSIPWLIHILLG